MNQHVADTHPNLQAELQKIIASVPKKIEKINLNDHLNNPRKLFDAGYEEGEFKIAEKIRALLTDPNTIHVTVSGGTGSGKTTFITLIVHQLLQLGITDFKVTNSDGEKTTSQGVESYLKGIDFNRIKEKWRTPIVIEEVISRD